MPHRRRIEIEQADQHVADDPGADRTETVAAAPHVRLAQDVVPERRRARRSLACRADLARRERLLAEVLGNRFARRQADALAALQITNGQRVEGIDLALAAQ